MENVKCSILCSDCMFVVSIVSGVEKIYTYLQVLLSQITTSLFTLSLAEFNSSELKLKLKFGFVFGGVVGTGWQGPGPLPPFFFLEIFLFFILFFVFFIIFVFTFGFAGGSGWVLDPPF